MFKLKTNKKYIKVTDFHISYSLMRQKIKCRKCLFENNKITFYFYKTPKVEYILGDRVKYCEEIKLKE